MIITSKDNPKIKALTALHKRDNARREGVVFLEGERLCRDAIETGVSIREVVVTEARQSWADEYASGAPVTVVSESCFAKIASTVHPQGIACVVSQPDMNGLIPFRGDGSDIYCYLEDVQDPGNLGTIIRTADAFDLTAVIMSPSTCDPYNEKTLRASMGSVWHLPLVTKTVDEACDFFDSHGIASLAMHLKGDDLYGADIKLPASFFIGNEGKGLTDAASSRCNKLIKIPMPGKAESLNAAAAASIMGFVLSGKRIGR